MLHCVFQKMMGEMTACRVLFQKKAGEITAALLSKKAGEITAALLSKKAGEKAVVRFSGMAGECLLHNLQELLLHGRFGKVSYLTRTSANSFDQRLG